MALPFPNRACTSNRLSRLFSLMRLLFASHSFPPKGHPMANIGGMQRVAIKLHEALAERDDIDLSSLLLRTSWRWTHVKVVPYLFRAGWQIYQKARAGEIDVVLFSSMVTAGLAVPLQSTLRNHGIVTAAIVHGRDVTLPFAPYQWFVPKVFDALDLVLPVSRATGAACLERGLPAEKMHVVPNGIDVDRFPPLDDKPAMRHELKQKLGETDPPLPDDGLLLCSVGRQVERKGFAWFTDQVMPRLPNDIHYWMAGNGPEAEAIQNAIDRHNLNGRVRRLGYVSEDTLSTLYRGADLFIMPNIPVEGDMEGFGVVMLEAGRCGTPVIAARLEGIRDVVTEGVNGHLVEPEHPEAFVEMIAHYYAHPAELRAASKQAVEHVTTTFNWTSVTDRYVQALTQFAPDPALAS